MLSTTCLYVVNTPAPANVAHVQFPVLVDGKVSVNHTGQMDFFQVLLTFPWVTSNETTTCT